VPPVRKNPESFTVSHEPHQATRLNALATTYRQNYVASIVKLGNCLDATIKYLYT
jgi:hypothetical protein